MAMVRALDNFLSKSIWSAGRMNGRFLGWPRLLARLSAMACAVALLGPAPSSVAQQDDDGIISSYKDRRNRGAEPEYRRNTAGDFDYYALVLSWSPTHCSGPAGADDDMQCNRQDGKRYSFIVHGLWPQYQRGWPENCNRTGSSFIPEQLIDRTLDIMPSKKLIIHEYRKHGTCSGLSPFAYFEFLRKEFSEITIPDKYNNPFESQFVAPGELVNDFLGVNPDLKRDMLAVSCGGAGNRLKEIHICLTKSGQPTACGGNENAQRMCKASAMFIPPARSSRVGAETSEARDKAMPKSPLPMPRVIPWGD